MEILLELNSNVLRGKALCVTKISKFQHFVNTINWKGTWENESLNCDTATGLLQRDGVS